MCSATGLKGVYVKLVLIYRVGPNTYHDNKNCNLLVINFSTDCFFTTFSVFFIHNVCLHAALPFYNKILVTYKN